MKTLSLEELYKKVMSSDELKKEYFAAANEGRLAEFLGAHDCRATLEELQKFLSSPEALPQGEISDDELDAVAGGTCYKGGRPVVTIMNRCDYWTCESCGGTTTDVNIIKNYNNTQAYDQCSNCGKKAYCTNCKYCRYESALWLCYNPNRLNN